MPYTRIRRVLAPLSFTAALILAACSGDSTGNRVGPAAHLDVVAGEAQTGAAGAELPQALVVRVTDASGDPVPGQPVNFVVTAGGGHVFAGGNVTNADGIAQERWTLGTSAADSQRVEARAVDNTTGQALVFAVFHATAHAAAATAVEKVQGDAQTGLVAGALPVPLKVRVRDAFGNPVAGATVVWTGPGSFAAATSATGADGVAQTTWTLGTTAGAQTATAAAGGANAAFAATARTGPGVPGRLVLSARAAQVAVSGQTPVFTAVWRDTYGNTSPVQYFEWAGADPSVARGGGGGTLVGVTIGSTPVIAHVPNTPNSADTLTRTVVPGPGRTTLSPPNFNPPALYAAWGPSSASYWVAGQGVVATASGTSAAVEQERITELTLFGMWGSSAADVYAVGERGVILHYDGSRWARQPSGTADTLNFVSGRSAGDVYAVGGHGRILHNNGSGWTSFPSPVTGTIRNVWVAPTGEVYITSGASVYRYSGGAWTSTSPSAGTATWLWGTSDTDVYASTGATTYRWNGTTWTALPPIPTTNYGSSSQATQTLGMPSLGNVYVVGYYQCTLTRLCYSSFRWDGTTWTQGPLLSMVFLEYAVPTGQWVLGDGSVVATLTRFSKVLVATPATPLRAVRRPAAARAARTR